MWRRGWLAAFLASVTVNAVLGIWALVSTDFAATQGKVLATSFCVSGAMLGVLVNGPAMAQRVRWPAPAVGAASAAAGFVLLIVIVWAEPHAMWWSKALASLLMGSVGASLIGLIGLLVLQPRYEPVRLAQLAATVVLVGSGTAAVWAAIDAEWVIRTIGVESVLVAALTLIVPALARYRPPQQPSIDPTSKVVVCPQCGTHIDLRDGAISPANFDQVASDRLPADEVIG